MAGLLASAATFWLIRSRGGDPKPVSHARMTLDLPTDAKLNSSGFGNSLTFSPDGASLVYVGGGPMPRLYVRRLDELTARPLPGTDGAMNPQFSPDGRAIGFVANLTLKRVPAIGGTPTVVAAAVGSGRQVPRLFGQLRDRAPARGMNAVHHHYFFGNVGQIKCEVRTTVAGLGTVFLRLGIPRDIARRLAGRLGKR